MVVLMVLLMVSVMVLLVVSVMVSAVVTFDGSISSGCSSCTVVCSGGGML